MNTSTEDKLYRCRLARPDDAAALADIYNETIAHGGHSPQISSTDADGMRRLLAFHQHNGWPLWTALRGDEPVAWASLRPISWGPQVCQRAGDVSVYVQRQRHGSRAALELIITVVEAAPRCGFDALSCWIIGSNSHSASLARGCGMRLWGSLPGVVRHGDRIEDLQIWGCRLDDAAWSDQFERMRARVCRRSSVGAK